MNARSQQQLKDLPVGSRFYFPGKKDQVHEVTLNRMDGGDVHYNQDNGQGGFRKKFDDRKTAFTTVIFLRSKIENLRRRTEAVCLL